ncbi:MAG: hypothetical protein ACKVOY_12620 [Burkholderiaceae bacterium]|jgi:ABC-type multidrug transport system permease subunit
MKKSIAEKIKNKAAIYYLAGIIIFSVIASIIVTIVVIVNRNS